MPTVYIVRRGDHTSSIAADHGFASSKAIWNAPGNADLRSRRKHPQQLVPGDEVEIPDREPTRFQRSTGQSHTFVVDREQLVLRLRVHDHRRRPLANASGELHVGAELVQVASDSTGLVEVPIARGAHEAALLMGEYTFQLAIGDLQPVSEPDGQWGRFVNLDAWFDADEDEAAEQADARELAFELVAAFERKKSDGQATAQAVQALEQAHDS